MGTEILAVHWNIFISIYYLNMDIYTETRKWKQASKWMLAKWNKYKYYLTKDYNATPKGCN